MKDGGLVVDNLSRNSVVHILLIVKLKSESLPPIPLIGSMWHTRGGYIVCMTTLKYFLAIINRIKMVLDKMCNEAINDKTNDICYQKKEYNQ